jgi:hypothetical protein
MATISPLASPKANILLTPMAPRSHARIVRILESEDMEPLKAPNFSQLGSDESDDDYTIRAMASKSPVLLLQPAELETGWSTTIDPQKGPNPVTVHYISTNTQVSTHNLCRSRWFILSPTPPE